MTVIPAGLWKGITTFMKNGMMKEMFTPMEMYGTMVAIIHITIKAPINRFIPVAPTQKN